MHWFIHAANFAYLFSYSVKSILWLRILTLIGIGLLIPYYITLGLWAACFWNLVFLGINVYRMRQKEK